MEVIPLGLQKRVELARALAAEPRMLVLDEPMAGMNQEEKEYTVRSILDAQEALQLTVLLIEHHMDVVTGICDQFAGLTTEDTSLRSYSRQDKSGRASRGYCSI